MNSNKFFLPNWLNMNLHGGGGICVLNTLDLDTLQRFTKQARELQAIVADIQPFFNTLKELDGKTFIPNDRLIRTHEAAQILGVSKATIGEFVVDNPSSRNPIILRKCYQRCLQLAQKKVSSTTITVQMGTTNRIFD